MDEATSKKPRTGGIDYRATPKFTAVALFLVINWFVFFNVSIYLGGDAFGTLPHKAGFVLESHGDTTKVSEGVWFFSLCYSFLTLGFTHLIVFIFLAYNFFRDYLPLARWLIIVNCCIPGSVFLFLVARELYFSLHSYFAMMG